MSRARRATALRRARRDAFGAALDEIFDTAGEPDETFVVSPCEIAGAPPAAAIVRGPCVRLLPVAAAYERAPHEHFADLSRLESAAVVVGDPDLDAECF